MNKISKAHYIVTFISIILLLTAFYNHYLLFNRIYSVDRWKEQFPILLALYLALSLFRLFKLKSQMVVTVFKTIILFILFIQYGLYPVIMLPVMSSIYVEMVTMENSSREMGTVFFVFAFIGTNLSLIKGESWVPAIIPSEIILFYIEYSLLVFIFIFLYKRREKKHQALLQEQERLNGSVNQLINANLDFQKYVYFIQQESIEKERNRISREIHDSIGYTLTNINMMMEAAVRLIKTDHDKLFTLLLKTRHQTDTGLTDMRRAMRELRTIGTELLKGAGGIQSLANTFQDATGVKVEVVFGNLAWSFPVQLENAIYRITQEGMTNAFRHGKATRVKLYFFVEEGFINISITDNGIGSTDIVDGIGLAGMKERLSEFSGTLSVNSSSEGFELKAMIPIKDNNHES